MDRRDSISQVRRVVRRPGRLEEDSSFASALRTLAQTGLVWGGLLGMTGIVILVLVNVGLLGRPVVLWPTGALPPEVFVVWDEGIAAILCAVAVGIGRASGRLSVTRGLGGLLTAAVVAVSLVADAYRGVLSIEYVILAHLLAIVALPYRPWQALLLGGGLNAVFFGVGHFGVPGTAAARPGLVTSAHLVSMSFVTVVLTGVATLLYTVRYRQHRARQEAERLHDQVARLERAKSRFFADLSHEFRTPLTLILAPLREVLENRGETVPEVLHNRLEGVEAQARRMKRLVDQLFELATLDEGEMALAMQKHDLGALVRRLVPPLRQWAEEEGLTVQVDGEADGVEAWVDADRLEQILTTLLSNAIRYTPDGGTVRVRVGCADGSAEIAVRDTGPGLPEALQDRIFGRSESYIPVGSVEHSEGDASSTEQRIGMGIGLAHAHALAQRHGGTIEVESEPGFGTELTVRLPLGREHVVETDVAAPGGGDTIGSGAVSDLDRRAEKRTTPTETGEDAPPDAADVLVLVGEADMRAYLDGLLGTHYRTETVATTEEALAHLRDRSVDLVLSDAAPPGADGGALCRSIREDEQLRHLPVILLTAQPEHRAQRAVPTAVGTGADAYVSKPFDPGELTARVENLIEIRRIVQERIRLPDWMDPDEATVSPEEAEFVEALNDAVDAHIDNSNFGVDWLADEMDLSARHLRRRIKDTTGLSASGFIRTRRLQHAAALLQQGADTVSGVADAVGYRDPSYFSRLFRETFGCSPTEYAEQESASPDTPDTPA